MSIEMFAILLFALNFIGSFIVFSRGENSVDGVGFAELIFVLIFASVFVTVIFTAVELGLYALVKSTGILNFLS